MIRTHVTHRLVTFGSSSATLLVLRAFIHPVYFNVYTSILRRTALDFGAMPTVLLMLVVVLLMVLVCSTPCRWPCTHHGYPHVRGPQDGHPAPSRSP